MDIRHVTNAGELEAAYAAYKHLRAHLSFEQFSSQVQRQQAQGFQVVIGVDEGRVVAAAGYRLAEFLAWGKVLYVDDLVTVPGLARRGYGGAMLDWLIVAAGEAGCDQVHLDTGYLRHDAHRLYLRKGFRMTCHHMELPL